MVVQAMTGEYKVTALINAEMYCDLSHILLKDAKALKLPRDHILPYGWSENIPLGNGDFAPGVMSPIFVWLIEGSDGPILVDTGLPDCEGARQVISAHGGEFKPCRQEHEWKLEAQLTRYGYHPDDIHTIILTHLHGDHFGNNELFSNARFFVHPEEVKLSLSPPPWAPFYRSGFASHLKNIFDRIEPVTENMQVSDGVRIVHIGGHSPGLLCVLVDTASGRIAIASDLVHSYRNLELDWPIGSFWNLDQVVDGVKYLKEHADIVLPNHDWELLQRFPNGNIHVSVCH
jgi:glyoxylase-like metal-dependent hydrolase (beta-lactamase superfamily II)